MYKDLFKNALKDLKVCEYHLEDALDQEEHEAREEMIETCKRIVENL